MNTQLKKGALELCVLSQLVRISGFQPSIGAVCALYGPSAVFLPYLLLDLLPM